MATIRLSDSRGDAIGKTHTHKGHRQPEAKSGQGKAERNTNKSKSKEGHIGGGLGSVWPAAFCKGERGWSDGIQEQGTWD
ncbi:hypothetical protein CMUS01_15229 [Colletotrichum musicola]|uniref:Uncharacterized protein n=1 Tax=Colletotrichum musicola TaxID=2175873 RepID=A0A8H6IXW7_9PEZI|nr:hypothetical protein CMUS01_15229 [Colletotrichum musicola]